MNKVWFSCDQKIKKYPQSVFTSKQTLNFQVTSQNVLEKAEKCARIGKKLIRRNESGKFLLGYF